MIEGILSRLCSGADDAVLDELIDAVTAAESSSEEIAGLARVLARSGDYLEPVLGRADIASTGGPGSLSTLLGPLYLQAQGLEAASLGVPGRPAGGIDVLATIPGFRTDMGRAEVGAALERYGAVHLLAGPRWAPLDARLFRRRQERGAQTLRAFALASLLAKKIALGVSRVGLDVRVWSQGNLGRDRRAAAAGARAFIVVARSVGVEAVCFLTDADVPAQGYIGRGEALVALEQLAFGQPHADLAAHAAECRAIAHQTAAGLAPVRAPSRDLGHALAELLEAHGSSLEALRARAEIVGRQPVIELRAASSGFLAVDLAALRDLLVARQGAAATRDAPFADPAGITLVAPAGAPVGAGDPIVRVRGARGDQRLYDGVAAAVVICAEAAHRQPLETIAS